MSYTQQKDSIQWEVQECIETYRKGTEKQKRIADRIQELANGIHCFQCLDTKQAWFFRGKEYITKYSPAKYYIMTCAVCPSAQTRDKWVEDSVSQIILGINDIRLFNKMNSSGADRFLELEKRVFALFPELKDDGPTYAKTDKTHLSLQKKTLYMNFELGKLVKSCEAALRAYCGDITSLPALLESIQISVSNCENSDTQEQILCEEVDKTKFVYIKILNKSSTKKKSVLGLVEYNKYKLNVDVYISVLKPTNDSAYRECRNIVCKLAINEIQEVSKIFLSIVSA